MARAVNLSEGGMGLVCGQPIPVNTPVSLQFELNALPRETHDVEGRIVYARPVARPEPRYELGVFFHSQGEEFSRTLAAEVARLYSTSL